MKEPGQTKEPHRTPRPALLDIVKIDESWAQVVGGGGFIKHLQTNQYSPIEWDGYRMVKRWGSTVQLLEKINTVRFTPEEIDNIHWGPEDIERPELKKMVTVFGEYISK